MKPMSRMQKRNTLHLDPPVPDTEENRKLVVDSNKVFGKTVIWNAFAVTQNLVAGVAISTADPVDNFIETKDDISAQIGVAPHLLGEHEPVAEPVAEPVEFPDDLICPHCGSKARTEKSYLKNHGDNCLHKL